MLFDILLIVGGIVLLAVGGDKLVDYAAGIALRAKLTPAVVGLTVVAFGTSAPELAVGVVAAVQGSPDIVLGNVLGSNIANIALILGLCALIARIPVGMEIFRLEYPVLILSTFLTGLLCRDGLFDRIESGFFVLSLVIFVGFTVRIARGRITRKEREEIRDAVEEIVEPVEKRPTSLLVLGTLASLVGLTVGSRLLVEGAVGIAGALGMSERVIGLTVVAVGTSLPELVASLAAALKNHTAMAVANIIGSNLFNLLFILGAAGLIVPLPVAPALNLDLIMMAAVTVLFIPVAVAGRSVSRADGGLLLCVYIGYTFWLILNP